MKKIPFILLLIARLADAFAQNSKYPTKFKVAQDGSGDFKTIQEAIMAFRNHSQERVTLFIKNGVYH